MIDFAVNNNNGTFRVFRNQASGSNAWLGLRLVIRRRDAYGAKVEVTRKNLPSIWRRVRADGSYLSASDPRILIGLGRAPEIESLTVHWADGSRERFSVPPLGRYTTIVQGTTTAEGPK